MRTLEEIEARERQAADGHPSEESIWRMIHKDIADLAAHVRKLRRDVDAHLQTIYSLTADLADLGTQMTNHHHHQGKVVFGLEQSASPADDAARRDAAREAERRWMTCVLATLDCLIGLANESPLVGS